jgi:predicted HAD superfamily Cof-like phosphohydrolase
MQEPAVATNIERVRARILKALDETNPSPEGLIMAGIATMMYGKHLTMGEDIRNFHEKFNQVYDGPPRCLPHDLDWRIGFKEEELREYKEAVETGDLLKQYDALVDLLFVIVGTMYQQGLPLIPGWEAVVKSNMSKEYVANGGKFGAGVHKGANYVKPDEDLNNILEIYSKK